MHRTAILSRDAKQYARLIKQAAMKNLKLIYAQEEVDDNTDYSKIDILLGDPDLTSQVVEECHNLKWLQSTWAGNQPLFNRNKTDYILCGVKDIFQDAMREYVFAYLLYFSRNIAEFTWQQQSKRWSPPKYTQLAGKTLGIMGVGNIGQALAKTAKSFAMATRGLTRTSSHCPHIDKYYTVDQLTEYASGLDYLVCLLPDSCETTGLINKAFLNHLPKHCVLINAGRGSLIVDSDLCQALEQGNLKAAVLDVFHQEPLDSDHPFWHTANLYITQHTAAESNPAKIGDLFIENYHRYINQKSLKYQLDFTVGY